MATPMSAARPPTRTKKPPLRKYGASAREYGSGRRPEGRQRGKRDPARRSGVEMATAVRRVGRRGTSRPRGRSSVGGSTVATRRPARPRGAQGRSAPGEIGVAAQYGSAPPSTYGRPSASAVEALERRRQRRRDGRPCRAPRRALRRRRRRASISRCGSPPAARTSIARRRAALPLGVVDGRRRRGRARRERRAAPPARRAPPLRAPLAGIATIAGLAFAAAELEAAARALPRRLAPFHLGAAAQARLAHRAL